MSEDDCIGGGNALQTMVISDIEELGHHFVGNVAQTSRRTPAPAPALAPALAPAPAPAPSPAPAPAPAPRLATPAVTLPRLSSVMSKDALPDWLQLDMEEASRQMCAAFRCQVFGSARASRRLLRPRAGLWRHRICPIWHSLPVFTTSRPVPILFFFFFFYALFFLQTYASEGNYACGLCSFLVF